MNEAEFDDQGPVIIYFNKLNGPDGKSVDHMNLQVDTHRPFIGPFKNFHESLKWADEQLGLGPLRGAAVHIGVSIPEKYPNEEQA